MVEVIEANGQTIEVADGETFEDKMIDVRNGDFIRIEAWGDNWTIRNIGVIGPWPRSISGHEQFIGAKVESPDATGTIDNVYFGDGVEDGTFPGITGIYVNRGHAGTLNINNVNIQGTPNNAIYASSPMSDGEGEVNITNSFAADCLSSHYRVGTDGSTIENCVAVNGDRGVWVHDGEVDVVGCDLHGHATNRADGDIVAGRNSGTTDAVVNVTDTYYGTSAPGDQGINSPGTINGSSVAEPRRNTPDSVKGVPRSPEEAANGGGAPGQTGGGGLVGLLILGAAYAAYRASQ